MNIKTFTAARMSDALALVKRQLGTRAVILHTRSYKQGGILGLGARTVVEVTAADGREIGRIRRQQALLSPTPVKPAPGAPNPQQPPAAGDLIRRTYAAAKAEIDLKQHGDSSEPDQADASKVQADRLAHEMAAVKRMVSRMMYEQKMRVSDGPTPPPADIPDQLFAQYLALLEQEVADELAQEVIVAVNQCLGQDDLNDEAAVQRCMLRTLAQLIPVDEDAGRIVRPSDSRPRTIALIGPTGVGKTTTIAKLAATFKLKQKLDVRLVTLDTYRIAAVDQLQTYADIIGVPLHVAADAQEMVQAMQHCRRSDVVLIDTAGRSQRDDPKLEQLDSFIRAAKPHEVHLVLASTCMQKVLLETVKRFSRVRTDRIIFTKLDEAVTFGVLVNVARKVDKRLSFVTTGQEVPHQIEPGRADRLAALMLGCQSLNAVQDEPAAHQAVERSQQGN